MKNLLIIILATLMLGASWSCESKDAQYKVDRFLEKTTQDSLMADIVTYIYKVPRGADAKRKHDLEYRKLYVSQIPYFRFVYFHINEEDSTHYFYLIRPARNEQGYNRGVLGKFKWDENKNITEFQEIAVTPMQPDETLLENGKYLWQDLMFYGHVDRYFLNKQFIEFPDERTRYDLKNHVWTYEKE